MSNMTEEVLIDTIISKKVETYVTNRCGICNGPIVVSFYKVGLYIDTGCDCTSFGSNVRPYKSWPDFTSDINNMPQNTSITFLKNIFKDMTTEEAITLLNNKNPYQTSI